MKEKKQYKRPEVKKIILRTDERVLATCKSSSEYGPYDTYPLLCTSESCKEIVSG